MPGACAGADDATVAGVDSLSLKAGAAAHENKEPHSRSVAARRSAAAARPECLDCSGRSEEHTSELQSPSGISYAVFCLKKKIRQYATESVLLVESTTPSSSTPPAGLRPASSRDYPALFFFNEKATPEIYTPLYTLSLHDALPISASSRARRASCPSRVARWRACDRVNRP